MRKILIVRLGAMGDILHALPAVTAIRATLPDAIIGWVVENKWSELLAASGNELNGDTVNSLRPVVNHLHCVDTQGWRKNLHRSGTAGTIKDVVKAIRSMHYDLALDFQGAIKSAVIARPSGAQAAAGFTNPRDAAARFFYSRPYRRSCSPTLAQN